MKLNADQKEQLDGLYDMMLSGMYDDLGFGEQAAEEFDENDDDYDEKIDARVEEGVELAMKYMAKKFN